jgi:selenocysteine lyase/cysteine desulfurase
VQALDGDFLVCSAYKFFGPHEGVLYGKFDLLDRLPAYKVRPADNRPPHKFETGTQNHEGIAGTLAAVEYLASVSGDKGNRRERILSSMKVIQDYERVLLKHLIDGLQLIKGLQIYGITSPDRLDQRVPTVAFRIEGFAPRRIAESLGERGIFVWDGNYYALAVTQRLDVEDKGGMVRVGLVHYNTIEEVDRLLEDLHRLTKS